MDLYKRLLFLPIVFLLMMAQAQTVGSFDLSIDFDEPDYAFTRTLYYFVPTDYSSDQSYPLVVGFRGGPHTNAGQFRDQLTFLADSIGAIIVCPENSAHFNNDEGLTKQLFNYTVDTTMAMYNIDPDFVYLTGLSYGGRHAVIVSMDTDNGPIPNIRGVIPFATGSNGHLEPNYDSAPDFPPSCVCIGLNDAQTFINVANALHQNIVSNGGESILNEIPGVGHTVVFPTYPDEMMECFNFIESTYESTATHDLISGEKVELNIFPNPATDDIQIALSNTNSVLEMYLIDASGKIVMPLNAKKQNYNVSKLSSGIYSVVVVFENGMLTERVVVLD